MAYQLLNSVASPNALLDALATFAGANGWTVDRNSNVSNARTLTLHYPGVTDYIHLYTPDANVGTMIRGRVSRQYDSGAAYNAQPVQSPYDCLTNATGPFPNVYLFADGAAVHAVIQVTGAIEFRHICFGALEKAGAYDGGTYLDGSYRSQRYRGYYQWNNHHVPFSSGRYTGFGGEPAPGFCVYSIPADSVADAFGVFGAAEGYSKDYPAVWTGIGSWNDNADFGVISGGADANDFDGRSIFHPIAPMIWRAGEFFSPLGLVRNTFLCNMTKYSPAQEVVIGGDTYVVFPFFKRSLMVDTTYGAADLGSHTLGYAVKKVP